MRFLEDKAADVVAALTIIAVIGVGYYQQDVIRGLVEQAVVRIYVEPISTFSHALKEGMRK